MSKSVKKRSAASTAAGGEAKSSQQITIDPKGKNANPGSKQSRPHRVLLPASRLMRGTGRSERLALGAASAGLAAVSGCNPILSLPKTQSI